MVPTATNTFAVVPDMPEQAPPDPRGDLRALSYPTEWGPSVFHAGGLPLVPGYKPSVPNPWMVLTALRKETRAPRRETRRSR